LAVDLSAVSLPGGTGMFSSLPQEVSKENNRTGILSIVLILNDCKFMRFSLNNEK
jgi:hypothetical protein